MPESGKYIVADNAAGVRGRVSVFGSEKLEGEEGFMTREIQFRGLRKSGEWLYGNFVKTVDGSFIIKNFSDNNFFHANVRPETVGQLTGLKDKNGVEIYEGDFLQQHNRKILLVYYSEKDFAWRLKTPPQKWIGQQWGVGETVEDYLFSKYKTFAKPNPLLTFTVIGNRYENTELLNLPEKAATP